MSGPGSLEPFSPPPTRSRRGRVASRIGSAEVAAVATVVLTAVALVVYFAVR